MVELLAATGGALLTACFVSVGSISYRGRQSRDDLVRMTTAVELLSDKVEGMHSDMRDIYTRLKDVEVGIASLKIRN